MGEQVQTWSLEKIRERLGLLSRKRAAASLERESLRRRRYPDDPPAGTAQAGGAVPSSARPTPTDDPNWQTGDATDSSLEDFLAGLTSPRSTNDPAGSDEYITIPIADLIAGAPALRSSQPAGGGAAGSGFPLVTAPLPLATQKPQGFPQLTAPEVEHVVPSSRREATRRIAKLREEIGDLDERISEIQRTLVRRSKNGHVVELHHIRESLTRKVPQRWAFQLLFDVDRFVQEHKADLRRAKALADACGETFPDRESDFLVMHRLLRERLFKRILQL